MFAFQNFLNFDINLKPISVSSKCIIKVLTELKSFREINRCYVIYSNEAVKCFFELGLIISFFFQILSFDFSQFTFKCKHTVNQRTKFMSTPKMPFQILVVVCVFFIFEDNQYARKLFWFGKRPKDYLKRILSIC